MLCTASKVLKWSVKSLLFLFPSYAKILLKINETILQYDNKQIRKADRILRQIVSVFTISFEEHTERYYSGNTIIDPIYYKRCGLWLEASDRQ